MAGKREHERALFAAFIDVEPEFADERLAEWYQPADERDPPDIIGTSIKERKIGVEIGEWLNEDEIQAARQKERLERILNAIGEQRTNPTEHLRYDYVPKKRRGLYLQMSRAFGSSF